MLTFYRRVTIAFLVLSAMILGASLLSWVPPANATGLALGASLSTTGWWFASWMAARSRTRAQRTTDEPT